MKTRSKHAKSSIFIVVVVVFYHLGCCDETGLHSFKLNTQIDAAANYNYI